MHSSESEAVQTSIDDLRSSANDEFHFIHGRGMYFSKVGTFETTIAGQQSSLKDEFRFIHGRGTPL